MFHCYSGATLSSGREGREYPSMDSPIYIIYTLLSIEEEYKVFTGSHIILGGRACWGLRVMCQWMEWAAVGRPISHSNKKIETIFFAMERYQQQGNRSHTTTVAHISTITPKMSTTTETMATSKMDKAAYDKLAKEWAALKAWCETAGTPQHMKLAAACKAAGVDGARCIRHNAKLRDQPENMRVEYCAKKVAEYTEKQTTVGNKRKDDQSEELASL